MFSRNKLKLLVIGPFPPPITGNSLATQKVYHLLKDSYNVNSINNSTKNISTSRNSLKLVFFYLKLYSQVFKFLSADIIYVSIGMSFWGTLRDGVFIVLSRILRKKCIIHLHGNLTNQIYAELDGIKKKLYGSVYSAANYGIVLSDSLMKNLTPFMSEKRIFKLNNFVDLDLSDFFITKKIEEPFKLKILYFSNLIIEKGIFEFIQTLHSLEKNKIPFEAKIAGAIDESDKILIISMFANLPINTTYLGPVFGKEKLELLKWGNIFILPTYYRPEGQPISILEAMSTGNIILTTRQGGIEDIVKEPKNGYFIEKRNPKSIEEKILYLSRNEKKAKEIQTNNHSEALSKYSIECFHLSLDTIIHQIS